MFITLVLIFQSIKFKYIKMSREEKEILDEEEDEE
jgi:hypothetical protein